MAKKKQRTNLMSKNRTKRMRVEIRTESIERGKRAEVVGEVDHVPERLTDTAEGKPLVLTPCFKKLYLVGVVSFVITSNVSDLDHQDGRGHQEDDIHLAEDQDRPEEGRLGGTEEVRRPGVGLLEGGLLHLVEDTAGHHHPEEGRQVQ